MAEGRRGPKGPPGETRAAVLRLHRQGLSQREIAARLGVSRAALYRYEKGEVIKLDTIRRLAELAPTTLAIMHGSCFSGDGAAALNALADDYDRRLTAAGS